MGQRRKTKDVDRRKTTRYSIIVLDFYCCINNFCKTCWFKTWHIYSFCVRNGLTGWFWPRVFYEVAVRVCSGMQSFEFCLGPGNLLPKWLTSHGWWQEVSVPHEADLSICLLLECPHQVVAGSPRRVSDPRQTMERGWCAFYNLGTHHHLYTGIIKSSPHWKRGELSSIFCGEEFCVEKFVCMF